MQKKLTQHKIALNAADFLTLVSAQNMQHSFPFHTHNDFGIGIILKGYREEKYIFKNTNQEVKYTLKPKDIFFINPNEKHNTKTFLNDYKILFLSSKTLNRFLKTSIIKPYFNTHYSRDLHLFQKIQFLFKLFLQEKKISKTSISLLEELINTISTNFLGSRIESKKNPNIIKIKEYIQINYHKKLSIELLAKKTFMSPYHFIREFKKQYGITPHQYLLQERIKSSLNIKNTNKNFTNTALELGFNDQSHFINCFKKHMGLNPKKFHL